MRPFKYATANNVASATTLLQNKSQSRYLAGGTNILDLMKEDVERPDELVDISRIKLQEVKMITSGVHKGSLSLGAMAKNSDTANTPVVRDRYPLLAQAILAGASAQIRNMATNGGNLLQRTRCPYFYDVSLPCNKRENGSGCGALEGFNRMHAIFGWSDKCVAVYPSDMAIALAALDATVEVTGPQDKRRTIPFNEFHLLPGDTPEKENALAPGELITEIVLPANNFADHSYYLKVRDRASYAFALVSVAAALEMDGEKIVKARLAMGGVAHKPWRLSEAENMLVGKEATDEVLADAAKAAMKDAKALSHNKFKVELGERAIVRAIKHALG